MNGYNPLTIRRIESRGFLFRDNVLMAVFTNKKQIKRAEEVLRFITAQGVDVSRLDGRFFAALSIYLCEEKDFNVPLLEAELRRIAC